MAQNRRRNGRRAPQRRAYDQARDARQRPPQRRQQQGYRETTLDLGSVPAGQAPNRRRVDNSIEFPQQQARRPQSGAQGHRRPGGNPGRSNASVQYRSRNTARRQPNGRLRPTEANLRDPNRREGKKRRKLTRAAIRRRRMMRRLTP